MATVFNYGNSALIRKFDNPFDVGRYSVGVLHHNNSSSRRQATHQMFGIHVESGGFDVHIERSRTGGHDGFRHGNTRKCLGSDFVAGTDVESLQNSIKSDPATIIR